jgi:preprotein translocase subunit SecG
LDGDTSDITLRGVDVSLFAVSFFSHVLNLLIIGLGLLLIGVILIQRGKGGGLVGAFGGAGGSSPFGSKAGDLFTRITIGMAAVWIVLIMFHINVVKKDQNTFNQGGSQATFSNSNQ